MGSILVSFNLLKNCNESVVAGQIELFARLTLAALGMPVFVALLQLITDILGV